MKPDLLSHASRALRAEHHGASDRALSSERLILARVRQRSERRVWRLRWLLPAVALLVVSGAAASAGRAFPALSRLTESWLSDRTRTTKPSIAKQSSAQRAPVASPSEPTPTATASVSAPLSPPPQLSLAPKPVAANRGKPSSPGATPSSSASVSPRPPAPESEELYRTAHRLHFVDRNPVAALTAWDRYLQAAPRGALVLEARYNRALALARLGRNVEAASALEPFARGEYGPYRQAEAKALVDQLAP